MTHRSTRRAAAVLVLAGAAAAAWTGLAQADGTGSHGISRSEKANFTADEPIRIKEKEGAQMIVSHITVAPGGHTPWHYHPGPHFVSVWSGTVVVYETDCSSTSYSAGTGFFDPGDSRREHLHVHTLLNPSKDESAVVVVTDLRGEDPRLIVAVDPQPAACFSDAA